MNLTAKNDLKIFLFEVKYKLSILKQLKENSRNGSFCSIKLLFLLLLENFIIKMIKFYLLIDSYFKIKKKKLTKWYFS